MRAYGPGNRRLSLVMLLFLAGCGGGGGGGGGGALQPLVYSGSTIQATVMTTNASKLAANVFGSSNTAGIIAGTSMEGGTPAPSATGMEGVTRTLNRAARRVLAQVKPTRSAQGPISGVAQPVNIPVFCTGGGSANITGTLDDETFTGTLTVAFSNCVEEGLTLNGSLVTQVLAFDPVTCGGIPTNFIGSTSRITIRGSGVSVDGAGSLQVLTGIISFPLGTETIINNLVNLNNLTGVMTMVENLTSTSMLDSVCSPTMISNLMFTSGRIFDNTHGFVDVTTIAPLQIALPQTFPSTGEIRLAGNGTALHVMAQSSTRVHLQLDTDNSGMPDGFIARMNWTDLTGPIGADIADTPDGDGMHNSWETFYGLDPQVDDSALDREPDGANNLAEYIAGTNPNGP